VPSNRMFPTGRIKRRARTSTGETGGDGTRESPEGGASGRSRERHASRVPRHAAGAAIRIARRPGPPERVHQNGSIRTAGRTKLRGRRTQRQIHGA